eukprot:SAG22_NODE_2_length_61565_cov_858.782010_56_plen_57_part_00
MEIEGDRVSVNCTGIKSFARPDNFKKIGDLFNMEKDILASGKSEQGPYPFITSAKV